MRQLKCVIVDDEPLARELLESYVARVPHLQLTGAYGNAIEAFGAVSKGGVDLLFLDIQMPGLTGLELLRSLAHKPAVIIVSAYSEYAVEGFNLDVTDYLLKPVLFERFLKAVGKLGSSEDLLPADEKKSVATPYLYFRVNKENIKVFLDEILWIESLKDYIKIKTTGGELVTYQRISLLEQKLPSALFLRVHRSYIIAKGKVEATTNEYIRVAGCHIPIGKSYKQEVVRQLRN
jgi:DNA-binding LytR/AlgR family response regulator